MSHGQIRSFEYVGQLKQSLASGASANEFTLQLCPRVRLEVGDVVRFGPVDEPDPLTMRREELTVSQVAEGGQVFWVRGKKSWVTALCPDSDHVFVERPQEETDDIAALEVYLASCVRRRDWHGASDAANDLRVLEAVKAAQR